MITMADITGDPQLDKQFTADDLRGLLEELASRNDGAGTKDTQIVSYLTGLIDNNVLKPYLGGPAVTGD